MKVSQCRGTLVSRIQIDFIICFIASFCYLYIDADFRISNCPMSAAQFLMSYMMGLSTDISQQNGNCNMCREIEFAAHQRQGIFKEIMRENCRPTDCTLKALSKLCEELGETIVHFHETEYEKELARFKIHDDCDELVDELLRLQKEVRTQTHLTDPHLTIKDVCDRICD